MRAAARIVAEADRSGGTRLAVLRGESPLLFRRTGPLHHHRVPGGFDDIPGEAGDGDATPRSGDRPAPSDGRARTGVTVHLVGGAAGPLRGDDLRLDIEVGPHARLDIRSVAATLLLPGRPAPPSRLVVHAEVGEGATLCWTPEPTIAAARCDHHAVTEVTVAEGGVLLWREDLVCGRHGEPSGVIRTETTIRYAGRTLYRHDLMLGAGAWDGAAVLGENRALGAAILAGSALPSPRRFDRHHLVAAVDKPQVAARAAHLPGPDAAVMDLAGPGVLATAAGPDIRAVKAALDPICEAFAAGSPAQLGPESTEPQVAAATI